MNINYKIIISSRDDFGCFSVTQYDHSQFKISPINLRITYSYKGGPLLSNNNVCIVHRQLNYLQSGIFISCKCDEMLPGILIYCRCPIFTTIRAYCCCSTLFLSR